jgi:GxxExxY protein
MPIECSEKIIPILEDEFHLLDYKVMKLVFSIHNEFGRLWNEKIFQNEFARRCRTAGFEKVKTEVPIKVSCQGFQKTFFIDLLLNNAIVYELKAVKKLSGEHHLQTINYLLLISAHHGKLINMRSPSVESRFVSTRLTKEKRYDYTILDHHWLNIDEKSKWLKQTMIDLIAEWGAFLDTDLFYSAINHFLGGEDKVIHKILVKNGDQLLGRQKVYLINSDIAFKISSMSKDEKYYEQNLKRILIYTSLKAIQWINFNHNQIKFKTIFQ